MELNVKIGLFKTFQISISTPFSSIWPTDWTLSGATTLEQSGHGSDGNKEVLRITKSSSIPGASPSDGLVSHQDTCKEESYNSEEIQSMYSAAPADWTRLFERKQMIGT